jgi:hypothetical protein
MNLLLEGATDDAEEEGLQAWMKRAEQTWGKETPRQIAALVTW